MQAISLTRNGDGGLMTDDFFENDARVVSCRESYLFEQIFVHEVWLNLHTQLRFAF